MNLEKKLAVTRNALSRLENENVLLREENSLLRAQLEAEQNKPRETLLELLKMRNEYRKLIGELVKIKLEYMNRAY